MKNNNELMYKKKNIYENISKEEENEIYSFGEKYKTFLNNCKNERESTVFIEKEALANGFSEFHFGESLKAGDKKYIINRGKGIVLFVIGENNLEESGIKMVASHIDSPRIDLKQVPVYENDGFCFFKTHYYGGIKKYQWTVIPLALHGVIVKSDGSKIDINVGEKEDEPIFYINDLLPHMSQKQLQERAGEFIKGEQLNIVIGSKPAKEGDLKIKSNILSILNDKYGITEEDFISAELSVVPALKARDVGFDRGLIAAYGHDDKVCAYSAYQAIFDADSKDTIMCVLVDKEEIGSEGNTGMKCKLYEDIIEEISCQLKCNPRIVRNKSLAISSDVTAAYDPNFAECYEKNNAAMISCGTCMCKYTGSRGKSGTSDASAELVGKIRKIFSDHNVYWQNAEMGKVDLGGGGTVAKFIAQLNIDTVDIGVPVISMHAPYELISKADLYSNYQACLAFYN